MPQVTIIEPRPGWKVVDWRELIEYRDLFYFLVLREVTVLYNQTVLGFAWAILGPLLSMVVFSVVFGRMAHVPSDGIPYPIFSYSALLPWTYFAGAFSGSTVSLIQGSGVFTKVYFPRLFIPLVPVFSKLVDFFIAFVILLGMMVWYGISPRWEMAFLPVLLLLMMLTASGMGMWLSALALQYRDFRYASGFVIQMLMYVTPVVWPLSLIPERFRYVYAIYPLGGVVEGFRSCMVGSMHVPWDVIGIGAVSSIVVFVLGGLYYRRSERIFADVA